MTNDELMTAMADLSMRMHKMESSLREFEKQRHQPLVLKVKELEGRQKIDTESIDMICEPIGELMQRVRHMANTYSCLDSSLSAEDDWLQEQIDQLKREVQKLEISLKVGV